MSYRWTIRQWASSSRTKRRPDELHILTDSAEQEFRYHRSERARLQVVLIHVRRAGVGLAQILGNVDAVLGEDEMREADAREPSGGRVADGGIRIPNVALRRGDDLRRGRRDGATGSGARAVRIGGGP